MYGVKNLFIAGTLSRVPPMALDQHDKHFDKDVQAYVDVILQDLLDIEWRLEEIRLAQENDPLCQEMAWNCQEG